MVHTARKMGKIQGKQWREGCRVVVSLYHGFDPQYPDPYPGGYKSKDCGTLVSTHVISFSSSVDEALYPAKAEIRECHEFVCLILSSPRTY